MSIDRTKKYYTEWVNDRDWNLRFEIIPAGEFVSPLTNIDSLTDEAFESGGIEIKSHKMSFDSDIPFGCREAASISFDFDFSLLPTNLQEILKNPFYDHAAEGYSGLVTSNVFVLISDRGTEGATEYVEFCGGQKLTLTNTYKISKDEETGTFITNGCTIDAVDVFKLVLEQTSTKSWASYILSNPTDTYLKSYLDNINVFDWITGADVNIGAKFDYRPTTVTEGRFRLSGIITLCHLYKLAYLFTYGLTGAIKANLAAWTRNPPSTYISTFDGSPLAAITFYAQNGAVNHAKGSTLTDDEVLTIGKIASYPDTGMLLYDEKGESYLEFTYMWDLLKNFTEGNCCKFTYKPLIIPDTIAVNRLSYAISFDRIFHNPSNTAIDLSTRFGDAHEGEFDFTPCSGVYTSSATELPNLENPDISNFTAEIRGNQSDERINVRLLNHNLPTSDIEAERQMKEPRIHLRKLYYNESGHPLKVHESVKIHDGITETTYDNVTALPALAASSNAFASEQRVQECRAWALLTQVDNGLPVAVSNFYLSRFTNTSQNKIPVTMYMEDGETMPENCGDIATIPVIDGFPGSEKAVMIEMVADWKKGTIDIDFISRGT